MKLATLTLPSRDNSGASLARLHSALALDLAETFGGCTSIASRGLWIAPNGKLHNESGRIYSVATNRTATFRAKAIEYGRRAKQLAIFCNSEVITL